MQQARSRNDQWWSKRRPYLEITRYKAEILLDQGDLGGMRPPRQESGIEWLVGLEEKCYLETDATDITEAKLLAILRNITLTGKFQPRSAYLSYLPYHVS